MSLIRMLSLTLSTVGMTALYLVAAVIIGCLFLELVGGMLIIENVVSVALFVMCAGTGFYTAYRIRRRSA